MGSMIDLTDEQDHNLLQTTEADGLFGGAYLDGQPLGAYLDADEQPAYLLRNKKSGVEISATGDRTLEPDGDYQAFALITDLRVLFVVGQAGGDQSLSVELPDIVESSVESSLRTSTLVIETLDDERLSFPCTDDPSTVADHIEEAAQVWANAARLLDDVETALGRGQDRLAEGSLSAAREQADDLAATVDTATTRIQEVGPAAHAATVDRADQLRSWLTDLERELTATQGARAHARAHDAWRDGDYESAAAAYDRAIERYQTALGVDGDTPSVAALEDRLRGVAAERELLRAGPLIDADTTRRLARSLADPEDAAGEWERALDQYRDLLSLDWGNPDGEFVADEELIREQTSDIADDAIDDHYEAGRGWLQSGDKLAVQDRSTQATQVYERAAEQFEHARSLATEIRPSRRSEIEPAIEAAEDRLDGTRPTETVPDDPIAFEPTESDDQPTEPEATEEGIDSLSFHDSHTRPTQSHDGGTETERPGTDSESVLDRIQAQKRSPPSDDDQPRADETTAVDPAPTAAKDIEDSLESLDRAELRRLVARLWAADGWSTSVVDSAGDAVYDVVAVTDSGDRRALLWIVEAEAGPVDRTIIDQCDTAMRSSQGADEAVVATTASTTATAESAADDADVSIVGPTALADRLRAVDIDGVTPTQ